MGVGQEASAVIIGNVIETPELHIASNGGHVTWLRVATTPSVLKPGGERIDRRPVYNRVSVWGQMADNVVATVRSGMMVTIVGEMIYRSWQDEHGARREEIRIVAKDVGVSLRYQIATVERHPAPRRKAPVGDVKWDEAAVPLPPESDD